MCDILKDIRSLLHGTQGSSGVRFRAVVFLIRRVLEKNLDRLWDGTFGGMRDARLTTQLKCLMQLARDERIDMDPVKAKGIYFAWRALSRACHYYAYDWTPTLSELESWIGQVEPLLEFFEKPPR